MKQAVALLSVALAFASSGCARRGGGVDLNDPPKDVTAGGAVFTRDSRGAQVFLGGVSVTLTGESGDPEQATTSATGLFEFVDVTEGVYVVSLSLAGYETVSFPVTVDATEHDVPFFAIADDDDLSGSSTPSYTFMGAIFLPETRATASVAPFALEVTNAENPVDGAAGFTITYDKSVNAAIVVTFGRSVTNGGVPYLVDGQTNATLYATTTNGTVFTFSALSLSTVNGTGLTEGALHRLVMENMQTFTPLNGAQEFFYSTIRFRAVP